MTARELRLGIADALGLDLTPDQYASIAILADAYAMSCHGNGHKATPKPKTNGTPKGKAWRCLPAYIQLEPFRDVPVRGEDPGPPGPAIGPDGKPILFDTHAARADWFLIETPRARQSPLGNPSPDHGPHCPCSVCMATKIRVYLDEDHGRLVRPGRGSNTMPSKAQRAVMKLLWNHNIGDPHFIVRCTCGWQSAPTQYLCAVPVWCGSAGCEGYLSAQARGEG